MRAIPSRAAAVAALACTLLLIPPDSLVSDGNGSFSADGRRHRSGTLRSASASHIVPTSIGGQSVATGGARIGEGPGLGLIEGRFGRIVYADAQCGHGPYVANETVPAPSCSGTLEPGGEDRHVVGPRRDPVQAHAGRAPAAASAVAKSLNGTGVMGAPLAAPVLTAAGSTSVTEAAPLVVIDGRHWRQAPPGTPERGPPGSRIILDDRVFLDADTTP